MPTDYKYFAFISYSHQDTKWGKWLHKSLEGYRIPKKLKGTTNSVGEEIPQKIYPIFRDREELPVSAELSENISKALQQSKYLIVICSPSSAKSKWVNEEIIQFKKLHGEDRILPIIVDGEPNVDLKPGWYGLEECFPPALKFHLKENGELSDERTEPICGDARKGKDGKKNALLKLIAGILATPYNVLKDREQQKRIRNLSLLGSVLGFLLIAFGWITWRAVEAEKEAIIQTNRALTAEDLTRAERDSVIIAKQQIEVEKDSTELARQDAVRQRNSAIESDNRTKKTLAAIYFEKANNLITNDQTSKAFPYIIEAIKKDLKNEGYKKRLFNLIQNKIFYISVYEPLKHDGYVYEANFSPDGKYIITASADGTANVWKSSSGGRVCELILHNSFVYTANFSPDGRYILTASYDGTARVWATQTGLPVSRPMKHNDGVVSANFSPNGKYIVTASYDGTARVWESLTGQPVSKPMSHNYWVNSAIFSSDGKYIVTASADSTSRVWEAFSGSPVSELMIHENRIKMASFSPDGKYVVTASEDNSACVWEAKTGKPVSELMKHNKSVNTAFFSPNGMYIVTASEDNTARLWDVAGKGVSEPMKHNDGVKAASFSYDGKLVITASWDGTARVWDSSTGMPFSEPIEHDGPVYSANFSPDGKYIVTASMDGTARVWERLVGTQIFDPIVNDSSVNMANFSPDGKYVLTASEEGTARIWKCLTGQPLSETMSDNEGLHTASFSPDMKYVVTNSWDGTAHIWESPSGQLISKPKEYGDDVISVDFSPDGKYLLTAAWDGAAWIWESFTGQKAFEPILDDGYIYTAQYSPDGKYVLTASEDSIARIWNSITGEPASRPVKLYDNIDIVSFSPSGKYVLAVLEKGRVQVWESLTGKLISEPIIHNDYISMASFSPNEKYIVTASWDNTARVWESLSGKAVSEQMIHGDDLTSAHFSPDGKYILTASKDGTARMWESLTGKQILEPMLHNAGVNTANFSFDGEYVLSSSDDGTTMVWNVSYYNDINWDDFLSFCENLVGYRLNSNGSIMKIGLLKKVEVFEKYGLENDFFRWYLTNPEERSIRLNSKTTFEGYKRKKLDDFKNTLLFELEELYDLSINDPILLSTFTVKLIANNKISDYYRNFAIYNSKRATYLDSTNWEVWYFRSMFLMETKEYSEALNAINKSIKLNPEAYTSIFLKGNMYSKFDQQKAYEESTIESFKVFKQTSEKGSTIKQRNYLEEIADTLRSLNLFSEYEDTNSEILRIDSSDYVDDSNGYNKGQLATAFGNLSFAQLLNKKYSDAIISAQKGIELWEQKIWIEKNLAHAYLFSTQFEKAKEIYLKYKDEEMMYQNFKVFKTGCLEDFDYFEEHGITHPDMERIRALLNN
ncbi:MAG: TIR domain-containing protein [Bacteroidales bacterium]|nr:TIR domain-containing protein [Bacteroidales bacterium]